MNRLALTAAFVIAPFALIALIASQSCGSRSRFGSGVYPNPGVDQIATNAGTAGTFVVPDGAYVTSWWAHSSAGGTVTITPTGPRELPTCVYCPACDAAAPATCIATGPAIVIPAGVSLWLGIPVLTGSPDELGAGTIFVFGGTDSYAVTVHGPGGSGDAAAP